MAYSKFNSVLISSVVSVVPEKVVTFDSQKELFNMDDKQLNRIKKTIGLDQRHVVEPGQTSLDLCLFAAKKLFLGTDLKKDDIDGLIFVTQTPDHFQPCNAAIAHGRLGLSTSCASFDVNLGCSGYVYGLWLAHMMVESGGCKKVLLLAGDTLSQCVSEKDRSVGPLFGDGGTATLIEKGGDHETYFSMHTDGSGSEHIRIMAGGFRQPKTDETKLEYVTEDGNILSDEHLKMDGGEVFNFSVTVEPKAISDLLEYAQKDKEEIDYIFFHQANKYIISNIVRRIKLPKDKAPAGTVEQYGNQSSASIPTTINDVLSGIDGDKKRDVILSGFGVGLSWASCLTSLELKYCPPVMIYEKD